MDSLPSVDYAYNLIQQEETRLRVLQHANTGRAAATDGIGTGLAIRGWQNPTGSSRGGGRGSNGGGRGSHGGGRGGGNGRNRQNWWEEKHGKPPQPQTPWNRGGHAAAAVGGDGGNAVQGVAQTAGAVQPGGRTGNEATQPVNTTGAANFVTGGSGNVIRVWSEELMREEAAPDSATILSVA
ncbi:putative glycine-rich cell wall structural protein 1 [Salvia splendens]|uniref:putative glycine-rich cell wall structural protein 1 n=1 Tax=Salvia splendens TaxID=180675 RepID=UPI001C255341|nr:putative glycine-rich cell wall structural protein 1 [Salvia splendens]